jgi:hypothetical protein
VVELMNNIKPSKLGGWRKRNCSNVPMEKKGWKKKNHPSITKEKDIKRISK